MHSFFLVVIPGFEQIALNELQSVDAEIIDPSIEKGGVEFKASLEVGFALNNLLRAPTKILLRLGEKKCKSFDDLRAYINETAWENYLISKKFKVKVSSYRSKLYHKRQLEDVITRCLKKYLSENLSNKKIQSDLQNESELVFRIEHNFVEVSLNTSGDALYKRGYKHLEGNAPLRETIAYGLLSFMSERLDKKQLRFLDPMCGTGTFLLESLLFNENLNRDFAYMQFPISKKLKIPTLKKTTAISFEPVGWDRSPQAIENAKKSFKKIGQETPKLYTEDLFNIENKDLKLDFVIFNPPYGERLALPMAPKKYWPLLFEKLKSLQVSRVGFIAPENALKFLPEANAVLSFSNGGVPVHFLYFEFNKV